MIPIQHRSRYFYHFTHLNNLKSILENGLLSINKIKERSIFFENIANNDIQLRRNTMKVKCKPNTTIHDYVPFYFCTINPMLLAVLNKKNIDQQYLIFFAISIDKILQSKVVFTNYSANTSCPPSFYNNCEKLDKLDWEAIDSLEWKCKSEKDKHNRMAEVLVYEEVPLDWIENIIVWNKCFKSKIEEIFLDANKKKPNISLTPFNGRHFYYTKFMLNRKDESLITGPKFLKSRFDDAVENIVKEIEVRNAKYTFCSISHFLECVENDFCCLMELKGIFELETDNTIHNDSVSDHTLKVVKKLNKIKYFFELTEKDKDLVKISAYLHDIGKGPKSKWENGIQRVYPDHPSDAIPMLERILVNEFNSLSKYAVKTICLLVVYHDLIGDILTNGRNEEELLLLKLSIKEIKMLCAISIADIASIREDWEQEIWKKIPDFIDRICGMIN